MLNIPISSFKLVKCQQVPIDVCKINNSIVFCEGVTIIKTQVVQILKALFELHKLCRIILRWARWHLGQSKHDCHELVHPKFGATWAGSSYQLLSEAQKLSREGVVTADNFYTNNKIHSATENLFFYLIYSIIATPLIT